VLRYVARGLYARWAEQLNTVGILSALWPVLGSNLLDAFIRHCGLGCGLSDYPFLAVAKPVRSIRQSCYSECLPAVEMTKVIIGRSCRPSPRAAARTRGRRRQANRLTRYLSVVGQPAGDGQLLVVPSLIKASTRRGVQASSALAVG